MFVNNNVSSPYIKRLPAIEPAVMDEVSSIVHAVLDQIAAPIKSFGSYFFSCDSKFKIEKYTRVLGEYVKHLGGEKGVNETLQLISHLSSVHPLVKDLTKTYEILLSTEGYVNDRERYHTFVKELRSVISHPLYQEMLEKSELTYGEKTFIRLTRNLARVRWFQADLYDYVKEGVDRYEESSKTQPVTKGTFSQNLKEKNKNISEGPLSMKKRPIALAKQKLEGALGIKDFTVTENVPFVRNIQVFKNSKEETREIKYLRHARPTMGGTFREFVEGVISRIFHAIFGTMKDRTRDGEKIAPDYIEAIRALKDDGGAMLYVVHQRRFVDLIASEGDSTELIENLDRDHTNFHTLVQTVEGDFYYKKGEFEKYSTVRSLKDALLKSFEEDAPNALPSAVSDDDNYKTKVLPDLFDKVMTAFGKEKDDSITTDEWKQMIQVFYIFQKDDLKFRLPNVTHYVAICKDCQDRAGNQGMVEDLIHYNMTGKEIASDDLEHTLYITAGVSVSVKKQAILAGRIEDGLKIADRLEKGEIDPKGITFGCDGWKYQSVQQMGSPAPTK